MDLVIVRLTTRFVPHLGDNMEDDQYILNKEWYALLRAMRKCFSQSEYVSRFRSKHISTNTGKRGGRLYVCDGCNKDFQSKDTEVHHINPVVELDKHYTDYTLDEYWWRLWCPTSELQLLCKTCHSEITAEQNKKRSN